MNQQVFRNARIVLGDEVILGSLAVEDGRIAAVASGPSTSGEDLGGDFLVPGLVELHTDHIEGHYLPRPKVRWTMMAALQAHDAQIAASGITTVFDALRVGNGRGRAADLRRHADDGGHDRGRGQRRPGSGPTTTSTCAAKSPPRTSSTISRPSRPARWSGWCR